MSSKEKSENLLDCSTEETRLYRIIIIDLALLLPALVMAPVGIWVKKYGLDYIYYITFSSSFLILVSTILAAVFYKDPIVYHQDTLGWVVGSFAFLLLITMPYNLNKGVTSRKLDQVSKLFGFEETQGAPFCGYSVSHSLLEFSPPGVPDQSTKFTYSHPRLVGTLSCIQCLGRESLYVG